MNVIVVTKEAISLGNAPTAILGMAEVVIEEEAAVSGILIVVAGSEVLGDRKVRATGAICPGISLAIVRPIPILAIVVAKRAISPVTVPPIQKS